MNLEEQYQPLLVRRIPRARIELGRAYVIHARNGGVGVALDDRGQLGYQLHRVKFGAHYLFAEYDWDEGRPFGTVVPLMLIASMPPVEVAPLLAWLREQEITHQEVIAEAWRTVLGRDFVWSPEP